MVPQLLTFCKGWEGCALIPSCRKEFFGAPCTLPDQQPKGLGIAGASSKPDEIARRRRQWKRNEWLSRNSCPEARRDLMSSLALLLLSEMAQNDAILSAKKLSVLFLCLLP